MPLKRLFLFGILLMSTGPNAHSKEGTNASKTLLDTTAIHRTYLDGDFDLAIDMIEIAQKKSIPFTHADSVFIFKHLGVMYTAKYETREKGKQYMMRLLQVEPSARIMDMYASDMIYMIFKNIQDEFEVSQARLARAKGNLNGLSDIPADSGKQSANPGKKTEEKSDRGAPSYAWAGWTAGALAAAGGVAFYLHMAEEERQPSRKENVLP